jgi:UPF0271 protein
MQAVIDTNVLLHSRGNVDFDQVYVIPEVVDEVRSERGKNILNSLDYEVHKTTEDKLDRVQKAAEEINSPTSDTDERLVALAMARQMTLVTDDKAMQNLCLHLGVDFEGFHDPALEDRYEWKKLCRNCGREVSSPPCPHCGSRQLRRKQVLSS